MIPAVSTSTASYGVWGLVLVVGLALWWLSHARPSAAARPSEVLAWLSIQPVARICLILGFMWLGWHLFAR